jgi:predicted nucleic acid-binding protein
MIGAIVSTVILDACLIITFGNVGELEVIASLQAYRVAIGSRSRGEVTRSPARAALDSLIASNRIEVQSVDLEKPAEQDALARFDARVAFRNRGDAELLALAVCRGWIVGSDERAIRSAAMAEVGPRRLAGTIDFLSWAVNEGRLSNHAAVELVAKLDVGLGIRKQLAATGRTLEDLF